MVDAPKKARLDSDHVEFSAQIPTVEKNIDLIVQNAIVFVDGLDLCKISDKDNTGWRSMLYYYLGGWNRHNYFKITSEFDIENSLSQVSKWKLVLGIDSESVHKNHLSLFLHRLKSESPNACDGSIMAYLTVKEVRLAGKLTKGYKRLIGEQYKENKDHGWGWTDFLELRKIVQAARKVTDSSADCLTIKCHVKFLHLTDNFPGLPSISKSMEDTKLRLKSKEQASQSLRAIMLKDLNSDAPGTSNTKVVLHMAKDDIQLNVNEEILCARSPVFAKMLHTEMNEKKMRLVLIEGIRSEAMKLVLEFMCAGSLPSIVPEENSAWVKYPIEIIDAAERYELELLKEFCDQNLISLCTPDNALEMARVAQVYNLKLAEKEIIAYIYIKNVNPALKIYTNSQ